MGSFCDMSLLLLLIHVLIIFEETYISAVVNSNNQTNNLHKNQTICLSGLHTVMVGRPLLIIFKSALLICLWNQKDQVYTLLH